MVGITGIGSGIDIDSIVKALVDSERAPKELQLNRLEKATTSRISALGSLRSVVGELSSVLQNLNKASAFQKQTVSSSSSSVLTASAAGDVPVGKFSLQVQQLAAGSKVVLPSVTGDSAATFNSGALTVSVGASSFAVNIGASNNSLLGVRDAINTAGASTGVSASIVTDASGSRLVLSSSKTGEGNDIKVAASQDGITQGANALTALAFSAGNSTAQLPVVAGGSTATFKAGTLNIASGAVNLGVAIGAADSLDTIRQKINTDGAAQGISATLETVDGGSRLVIQSSNGESLSVTATTDNLSAGDNSLTTLASTLGSNSKTIDTAKSALFKVDGLSAGYGAFLVLRDLKLDIQPGLTVVLGPNGAGKTTLLKALNGLIPRGGSVLLDGTEMPEKTHEIVQAGVALVPEGRQLFPQLTVAENLELGGWLVPKAQRAERLAQAFVDFPKLKERATQLAGTMSGGEQQMVAVARAMMCAPRLLMLDEPSLGLAPRMVDELLTIVRRIADAGTTVLMVEQNVKKALAVADRGYVMERGTLVASGPAKLLARSTVIREAYLGADKDPATGTTSAADAVQRRKAVVTT